jgi:hypothetical protein
MQVASLFANLRRQVLQVGLHRHHGQQDQHAVLRQQHEETNERTNKQSNSALRRISLRS